MPGHSRRTFLTLATSLSVSLPIFTLQARPAAKEFAYHLVDKQFTANGIKQGALIIVDELITEFVGDGFYLYPDWGKPIVYEVRKINGQLAFYYPGMAPGQKPLWSASLQQKQGSGFSGRVEGILGDTAAEVLEKYSQTPYRLLQVPESPPA